ncbi:hypothetical protein V6679_29215 [Nocardia testacea]
MLQIAHDRGITVIGTAGTANQDYLRSLGAVATICGDGSVERVRRLGHTDAARAHADSRAGHTRGRRVAARHRSTEISRGSSERYEWFE